MAQKGDLLRWYSSGPILESIDEIKCIIFVTERMNASIICPYQDKKVAVNTISACNLDSLERRLPSPISSLTKRILPSAAIGEDEEEAWS